MVWTLEGSGCEAHHLLWYSFCVFCPHTRTQHTIALSPSLPLSLSFTHSHWVMHSPFFSTWGTEEGWGDAQRQIEMLQWVLSWHDAWLMRCSLALLLHFVSVLKRTGPTSKTQEHSTNHITFSCNLLTFYTNFFLDLAAKFDCVEMCKPTKFCGII